MSTFLDDSLVGLALLISAGYAVSALGPRNLRRSALKALSAWLARASAVLGMCRAPLRRAAERIARAAEIKPQGACGGCDNCGNEGPANRAAGNRGPANRAAANRAPGAPAPASAQPKEITVPIGNIGRARR
jgi:hypothetical protein